MHYAHNEERLKDLQKMMNVATKEKQRAVTDARKAKKVVEDKNRDQLKQNKLMENNDRMKDQLEQFNATKESIKASGEITQTEGVSALITQTEGILLRKMAFQPSLLRRKTFQP